MGFAATSIGNYAIVAGGETSDNSVNTVDILRFEQQELIKENYSLELTDAKSNLAVTWAGDYAIFAGGDSSTSVDVFYKQDDRIYKFEHEADYPLELSVARGHLAAATVGLYALFAGGNTDDGCSNAVDVFMNESNCIFQIRNNCDRIATGDDKSSGLTLQEAKQRLAATNIENYAIFAGGWNGLGSTNTVDIFKVDVETPSIERVVMTDQNGESLALQEPRHNLVAARLGSYAIFAGGNNGNDNTNTVDIFKLEDNQIIKVNIYGDPINNEDESGLTLTASGDISVTNLKTYAIFAGCAGCPIDIFYLTNEGTIARAGANYDSFVMRRDWNGPGLWIENYAIFLGAGIIDIFDGVESISSAAALSLDHDPDPLPVHISGPALLNFPGLTSDTYITTDIVLDSDDEALAERQLREWGKISHISAGDGNLIVRCFGGKPPEIPLKVRVTVWRK